jgi:hypothetical protein
MAQRGCEQQRERTTENTTITATEKMTDQRVRD